MKKLLPILLVLILAGGAAWWFLLREAEPESEGAEHHESAALGPSFIDLDPLTVPVVRDGVVERVVRIDLSLELKESMPALQAEQSAPRLTDVFVVELYALLAHRRMEEQRYDTAIIKKRLQAASDRLLGPGVVAAVLVQGMAVARGS
jgi:flagellar basal body-associated protein FliL